MKKAAAILLCLVTTTAQAEQSGMTLSLDEYVERAIREGTQGLQNVLTFQSAGYTREIAFRQTEAPTIAATGSATRSQTIISGNPATVDPLTGNLVSNNGEQKLDTAGGGLNLTEQLPTGTSLTANSQRNLTSQTGFGQSSNSDNPNYSASLTQPLYLFVHNPVWRSRRQAELAYQNAKDSFASGLLNIRTQARSLYYSVMQSEESIKVEQRKVKSSQQLLDVTQALVEAGKSAPVETMRVKLQYQSDQRALETAVANRNKAVLSAKEYVNIPFDATVQFSTQLQFKPFQPPLSRLVDYALLHQPTLVTLRRSQELAKLSYQASVDPARPSLSLTSGYTYNTNSTLNQSGGVLVPTPAITTRGWNIGALMNWTLFDSFVTRDQVNIAKIGLQVADINLRDAERTTRLNVENAYLDVKTAEKQIQDFQNSREQSQRNVEVLQLRFRSGLERLIDVFRAQDDMRNLDNEYLGLLVSYNRSKDALSQQIGVDVDSL